MKRKIAMALWLAFILSLAGCGNVSGGDKSKPHRVEASAETEEMPADYGDALILAQDEFNRTFAEFANLQITETSTMARTAGTERVVIQFRYSSDNGNGVYGFEIEKTAAGSYDIVKQGENVTIDNLVKEQ